MSVNDAFGTYKTTAAETMGAYDRLPPALRTALREAVLPWCPHTLLADLDRGFEPAELARFVRRTERLTLRREARDVWGPDYPVQR